MAYWLVKSEPSVYSIDDMCREKRTLWHGVRNYQARNFLRSMKVGEQVLFYHSSEEPIGVAGVVAVASTAVPDPSQFDKKSEYFDEQATRENPRWFCPELQFLKKFPRTIPLVELKSIRALAKMPLLQRGSRLSVQPVQESEFEAILKLTQVVAT